MPSSPPFDLNRAEQLGATLIAAGFLRPGETLFLVSVRLDHHHGPGSPCRLAATAPACAACDAACVTMGAPLDADAIVPPADVAAGVVRMAAQLASNVAAAEARRTEADFDGGPR